jgi:hypothetical protein
MEEHRLADFPGRFFLLGFVEVDDQGQPATPTFRRFAAY